MKKNIFLMTYLVLCWTTVRAQQKINDEALRYQEQRMVFQQWDQNKFKPSSGFLGLNPFYWLVWGFPYPNYHKTDLRPLSPAGPQTQRLAAVAAMQSADDRYKLQSDTVRNTTFSQIASQSGLLSDADPLWLLYYKAQFTPVLKHSLESIMAGIPFPVQQKLITEGLYDWYVNELDRLKERVDGAHNSDMDRGTRIMAYYRLLREYRNIAAVWTIRTSTAKVTMEMTAQQQKLSGGTVRISNWTPQSDIEIAQKILQHIR